MLTQIKHCLLTEMNRESGDVGLLIALHVGDIFEDGDRKPKHPNELQPFL